VLTYHRERPAESTHETVDARERVADASGGRVFSAPNPFTPTLLPGPPASSASSGTGAPRSGSGTGYVPTQPRRGVPQPGTTYTPAPGGTR
jgi:hypothetical protein